ncbi:universal stress protein [Haloplanus halobius]
MEATPPRGRDLIVMGRTGAGDSETRVGSVTDRVLRTPSCPCDQTRKVGA